MPTPIHRYSKRIALYFNPRVENDAAVLDMWRLLPTAERNQDVFRRALYLGLRLMAENGDIPDKVLAQNGLRERIARRLPAAFVAPALPAPGPYGAPAAAPIREPRPPAPAPIAFEPVPDDEPDIDAMLAMMGSSGPMVRDGD